MSTIIFVAFIWMLIGFVFVLFKESTPHSHNGIHIHILREALNHCRSLGIGVNDLKKMNGETLKRVYREKAKETHPDKGGSQKQFLRVKEAYEYLKIIVT